MEDIRVIPGANGDIAVASTPGQTPRDALDLIATARHVHGCGKLILPKACLPVHFFDLKTGLAGEMLQKFTNYRCPVAVVGDFSAYTSTALRDFIRESNRGGAVLFLPDEATAAARLQAL